MSNYDNKPPVRRKKKQDAMTSYAWPLVAIVFIVPFHSPLSGPHARAIAHQLPTAEKGLPKNCSAVRGNVHQGDPFACDADAYESILREVRFAARSNTALAPRSTWPAPRAYSLISSSGDTPS